MAANGQYNAVTDVLTITGNGLPTPVLSGTFPNSDNSNTITSYTFSHNFTYRGGDDTVASGTLPVGIVGISANGVAIYNASGGPDGTPPQGFNWVGSATNTAVDFGEDNCGGYPETTGQYHYRDSHFLNCWKANQVMSNYNDYYGSTQYQSDNMRHPDGHSKIIGFCFDGYPIYGPYGYDNPSDNTSAVKIMVTGYKMRDQIAVNRPAYDSTYPKGAFIQDYEYNADITGRNLDAYNGRYCHTPEFPNGTFAYFMSIHDDLSDDKTYVVTVSAESDGNKYRLDGVLYPDITFTKGSTYTFDQSDPSNASHNIRISATLNGPWNLGTEYNSGVTYFGTPGQAGAKTVITVPQDAPANLYYYCLNHSGMANNAIGTVIADMSYEPKFPFIFGLVSKQQVNVPANQGIQQESSSGGGDSGGGDDTEPPNIIINSQPTNATIANGGSQTFTVLAEVQPQAGIINYQWQVSTDGGFAWSNITGATSNTYTLVALSYMTGYRYRVVLIGPVGESQQALNSPLASNLSILTVTGGTSGTDTSGVLKWDSNIGRYDMTAVPFDRDNNNPDFTTSNVRFDLTNFEFDLT